MVALENQVENESSTDSDRRTTVNYSNNDVIKKSCYLTEPNIQRECPLFHPRCKNTTVHFFRYRGRANTKRNAFTGVMDIEERVLKKPIEVLE